MGLILHFPQSPINFTNTVIYHQDIILPLLSAYSILLYHYVTDVCYHHDCLQNVKKSVIKSHQLLVR